MQIDHQKEGDEMDMKPKQWVCAHCGYTANGKFVGDICPQCGLTYWKCTNSIEIVK